MEQRFCKKCLIREISESSFHELIEKNLEFIDTKDKTSAKKYDERLAVCKDCDKLNSGTCLACGCYVEIRAAIEKNKCPKKKW